MICFDNQASRKIHTFIFVAVSQFNVRGRHEWEERDRGLEHFKNGDNYFFQKLVVGKS